MYEYNYSRQIVGETIIYIHRTCSCAKSSGAMRESHFRTSFFIVARIFANQSVCRQQFYFPELDYYGTVLIPPID